MIEIRRSDERGHFNHGWLDTYHTFSFADYRDPRFMGFRSLRVINEDHVAPGEGFGRHSHRDMEILTYVLSGELEHRDSLGNGAVILPGEVQYMAAGTGVEHSERNPSPTTPVHLMQFWILPAQRGDPPKYEQRKFPSLSAAGTLTPLASPTGRDGSIRINQDALVLAAALRKDQDSKYVLEKGRGAWLQLLRGDLQLNGQDLHAGDGASITAQTQLDIHAVTDAEALIFDLA